MKLGDKSVQLTIELASVIPFLPKLIGVKHFIRVDGPCCPDMLFQFRALRPSGHSFLWAAVRLGLRFAETGARDEIMWVGEDPGDKTCQRQRGISLEQEGMPYNESAVSLTLFCRTWHSCQNRSHHRHLQEAGLPGVPMRLYVLRQAWGLHSWSLRRIGCLCELHQQA